jgi:predicted nucleotidyltransferase
MVPRVVSGITHVVFIPREGAQILAGRDQYGEIPGVLARLGSILPRDRFMVIAPGLRNMQTGSITACSQFSGAAAVAEISSEMETGVAGRSWGTGFFRDLVESSTASLNFSPERAGCRFNGRFFKECRNRLTEFLPDMSHLSDAISVVHIPSETGGRTICVSSTSGEALVFLAGQGEAASGQVPGEDPSREEHWKWRQRMAEEMAASMDTIEYGVKGVYLFGSSKNATAGPRSDIDLIIHITGDPDKKSLLMAFLSGWDSALRTANLQRTGIWMDSMLDVHLITDEDIQKRNSYAVKIGAVTDPARPLVTGGKG